MLTELAAALVGAGAGVGSGFVLGSRWACGKVRNTIERVHGILDDLDELDARRAQTGGASATWTPAPDTDPDLVLDREGAGFHLTDRMDLEAFCAYQEGLLVWDKPAVDRLLAAIREVPTCEVHEGRPALFIVTWLDVDSPHGEEFLVCQECRDIIPGGMATVERLRP